MTGMLVVTGMVIWGCSYTTGAGIGSGMGMGIADTGMGIAWGMACWGYP